MTLGVPDILEMVELIYDAPEQPDNWASLVKKFEEHFPQTQTVLGVYEQNNVLLDQSATFIPEKEMIRYASHFVNVNPIMEPLLELNAGTYFDASQLVSRTEFLDSEYYNDFWKPLGELDRNTGYVIESDETYFSTFCTHYSSRNQSGDNEISPDHAISILGRHLLRSLKLQRQLSRLSDSNTGLAAALDTDDRAIFLLDSHAKILHQNTSAISALQASTHLSSVNGHCLEILDPNLHLDFIRALEQLTTFNQGVFTPSTSLNVTSSDAMPSGMSILLAPAPTGLLRGHYSSSRRAIAYFSIENKRILDAEHLSSALNITPAEARVAYAIHQGLTLQQYANDRHLSIHTVRNQLKSIYEKTGTRRQAELVSLIASLPR